MNLSDPHSALLRASEGDALAVLAATTRPLSGREVARLSGGSPSTVWRALQRLVEHGVVRVQEAGAGAVLLYTLNRDHVATEAIQMLMGLRGRFFDRLVAAMQNWSVPPAHASVFGSAARADGDTTSDIDLFIVRPSSVGEEDGRWRDQLDHLPGLVLDWTGNHAGIAEVSSEDVRRLERDRPTVLHELSRDAITLIGPSFREIIAATS